MGVIDWAAVRDNDELVVEKGFVEFEVEDPGDNVEWLRDVTNNVGDGVGMAVPLL